MAKIGVVVIGRNEGRDWSAARSRSSTRPRPSSTSIPAPDDSVALPAPSASGVELDMSIPFTAARGAQRGACAGCWKCARGIDLRAVRRRRLRGRARLAGARPAGAGSAVRTPPWCAAGGGSASPTSRYNRLCDMEWDTPGRRGGGVRRRRADARRGAPAGRRLPRLAHRRRGAGAVSAGCARAAGRSCASTPR